MEEENLPQYAIEFRKAVGDNKIGEAAERVGIGAHTAGDLYNGRVKDLENINIQNLFKVWKTFRLPSFHFDVFDPIKKDDSFALQLKKYIFIRYHGSAKECAKDIGMSESSFHYFFAGKTNGFGPRTEKKLREKVKIPYFGNYDGETAIEKREEKPVEDYESKKEEKKEDNSAPRTSSDLIGLLMETRDFLNSLSKNVANKLPGAQAIDILRQQYNPTLENRISTVQLAIDIINEELDYFREAPQEEREKLGKGIDTESFGYMINVLGSINKGQSYETFFRTFGPPSRKRLKRREK